MLSLCVWGRAVLRQGLPAWSQTPNNLSLDVIYELAHIFIFFLACLAGFVVVFWCVCVCVCTCVCMRVCVHVCVLKGGSM